MARTRAEDYDDKQRLILDKAAEVFAEKGFATASVNDISAATGMSKSALYHYHCNKEAILYAILTDHVRSVLAGAEAAAGGAGDPVARFRAFVASLVGVYASARAKHVVLMNDTAHLGEAEQAEVRGLERRLVKVALALLAEVNPGAMRDTVLQKPYAMMLYGMVNWTYTWYDAGGRVTPEELANRMADLFLRGFLPQPGADTAAAADTAADNASAAPPPRRVRARQDPFAAAAADRRRRGGS